MLRALALTLASATAAMAQDGTWPTYNGDLAAQKFSPLTEITPENVASLVPAWTLHTGDVSDGVHRPSRMHGPVAAEGTVPPTVWSATPLFVNDTLYLGTPFYRIFAVEPDTGQVKWTYDSHAVLEALTQPDHNPPSFGGAGFCRPRPADAIPLALLRSAPPT